MQIVAIIVFTALSAVELAAQPRRIEAWGNLGIARVAGDEGSNGSGPIYGGGIAVPLTKRLAIELDVAHIRSDRFGESKHTMLSPAVVWRWGTERVYGFLGGGLGTEATRSTGFLSTPGPDGSPSFFPVESTNYSLTLHGRGGIVFSPYNRVFFRAEMFSSFQYVLPTVGFKGGIGYRF